MRRESSCHAQPTEHDAAAKHLSCPANRHKEPTPAAAPGDWVRPLMRAVLGLIGLVVALAVIALLVKMQLKAAQTIRVAPADAASVPTGAAPVSIGAAPASPRQVSRQVADDIAKAMQQDARRSDGDTARDAEK